MIKYRRLTQADRYQIEALVQSGISYREISRLLKCQPSTVSREVKRNREVSGGDYDAVSAELLSHERRKSVGPAKKITGKLEEHVRRHLELDWSPEQISGRLWLTEKATLSHETIYKYIYADRKAKGNLWQHTRRHRRWRKSHVVSRRFKQTIGARINRSWIEERPKNASDRSRLGDFERDTVLGKKGGAALLTLVDRKSRLLRIRFLRTLTGIDAHATTVRAFKGMKVQTITNDNGHEFCRHKETASALNVKIFFCKPYRSYERGTNENTNGLIRQYFPKGEHPDPRKVARTEDLLNNRPRKCLGFKTPNEVHKIRRVLR